jgi:high-affinity nickel permease
MRVCIAHPLDSQARQSFTRKREVMRLWLRSVLTLVLVALAAYAADRLLLYGGIGRRGLLIISDLLIGLVAGILAFILGLHHAQRDRFVAARLRIIREMNHHIRNALQVITFHARSSGNENEIRVMQEAADRITWALREVLPQIPAFEDEGPEKRPAGVHGGEDKVKSGN